MSPRAPKHCGHAQCTERTTSTYCPTHTPKAWANAPRIVPPDWKRRVAFVLARDGRVCYVCGGPGADEVDHVINVAVGGTDEYDNLRAIHAAPCHREKSKQEALVGLRAYHAKGKHPVERHPGLLP